MMGYEEWWTERGAFDAGKYIVNGFVCVGSVIAAIYSPDTVWVSLPALGALWWAERRRQAKEQAEAFAEALEPDFAWRTKRVIHAAGMDLDALLAECSRFDYVGIPQRGGSMNIELTKSKLIAVGIALLLAFAAGVWLL